MLKRLSERFFKWYCHPDYYEDIQGDLEELYHRRLQSQSSRLADWSYAKEVLLLFRPAIIRPFKWNFTNNITDMIKNYFKIGLRNLQKHPSYTFIHILGLALGLTAFLFITHYISFEKSYDSFHYAPDQLYRLTTDNVVDGKIQVRDAMSFAPSGKALQEELPEVLSYTTTFKLYRMVFKKKEQPVEEKNLIAVDSNFLNLFRYEVLKGNKATMLNEPYTVALTESQAEKYFGNIDPIGQSIEVLGRFNRPFRVTGLLKDTPENTHYKFNMLVSLKSFQEQVQNDAWNGYNYYTYLLLDKNADIASLQSKMPDISKKHLGENNKLVFNLQAVPSIHLHSDFTYEPEIHGSAQAIGFLSIISIFILLIAWVNYINLSTARAMERAKEVGLRKVVGAQKRQLVGQFLLESLIVNFLGAITALFLAQLLLPYFNELVGKNVLTNVWSSTSFLKQLGFFFLLGTLLTGLYPAFVLSSFRPIGVLKGSFGRSKQGGYMRKTLVIIQFAASIILLASTIIIYQQVRYMTNKDLGIDMEQVIGFSNPEITGINDPNSREEVIEQSESKYKAFSSQLSQLSGISKVGAINDLPGGGSSDIGSQSGGVQIVGKTDLLESTVYVTTMNDQLIEALGLDVISGRNFNQELVADTAAAIVNQAFLQLMNVNDPKMVLNEYLQFGKNPENQKFPIVGVVNNYNRSSLKNTVEPTIFFHDEMPNQTVVKLNNNNVTAHIESVQRVWSQFYPDTPFAYTFLDQRFEKLYLEDKKFGFIFFNFALLAIFVASMGLFGLASYLSLQRTKEVGIRKVLGASVSSIVLSFFKDFLKLVLIAAAISLPLTYFSMNDWLEAYAYRIHFPWWVLYLAVILVVILAFFTVSYQTWKLALTNPAKTIRYE